jgi:hypothetical protein
MVRSFILRRYGNLQNSSEVIVRDVDKIGPDAKPFDSHSLG